MKDNDDLQAKIVTVTRKLEAMEMQKVNEVTTVPKVPSAPTRPRMEDLCIICDDPTHLTTDCPNLPKSREPFKPSKLMLSITRGSPSTLHIRKLIIRSGVNTLTLAGRVIENMLPQVKATISKSFSKQPKFSKQNFPSQNFKTKGFQIKLLISKIKDHKDFLRFLVKAFTLFHKEIKIINLTNLHLKEIWRTL